jgi:ribosomal-protein-alanine N-acetyltransferase
MSSIAALPLNHTYYYEPNATQSITFSINAEGALRVTIETAKLYMRSIEAKEEDYFNSATLYGDPEVMGKFATGQTKTRGDIESSIRDIYAARWNQRDPYSSLVVYEKETKEFVGHVILNHGGSAGEAELAYLFMKNHWRKGYGSEAASAVVKRYAPATVDVGYTLEGQKLHTITATARPDNPGSLKILQKLRMHKFGEEEKYGAKRHHFAIDLSELPKVKE